MLYVIHALDKPGHVEVRRANMPAHVEYVKSQSVKLVLAGPLMAEDHQTPIGTVLVVDAENLAAAQAFADGDPYRKADLFAEVRVNAWRKTIGWVD